MATFKIPGAKWSKLELEAATEKYDIEKLTDEVALDDLFPDEPEHFYVHKGDLTVSGKLALHGMPENPEPTVYVIDGNLTVDGPMLFENMDVYTGIYVTGNLKAKTLAVTWDSALFVKGEVQASDLLFTYLTDAGHFVAKKGVNAKVWLEAGGRGVIVGKKLGETNKLMNRSDEGKKDAVVPVLLPKFVDDGNCSPEAIVDAIMKGKPILR